MRFTHIVLLSAGLCMSSPQLLAETRSMVLVPNTPQPKAAHWLSMQREGNQQSKKIQTQTPAERELALKRLLKSYEHAIPDYYDESDGGSAKR